MVTYHSFTLKNGLRVIIQPVSQSTIAVVNMLYHVGSCNESFQKTGIAHLLEHIMFGSSQHIPSYDRALEKVGGQNNAYTSNDITNYWCKLPANKLEVALWLESDRLLAPVYSDETIDIQRKVVIEEFKQTCLNKPYGNVWHYLLEQAYKVHPYAWPTIGKTITHIENTTKTDIIHFASQFYTPQNAILVISGGIDPDAAHKMVKKWFEDIPANDYQSPILPKEPRQHVAYNKTVVSNVPQNALYKTYHIPGLNYSDYGVFNLLSNILGVGKSSLLYKNLVEEQNLFSNMAAYTTQTLEPGLFVIEGKMQEHVSFQEAAVALQKTLDVALGKKIAPTLLQKAKNQEEAAYLFNNEDIVDRAETLAYGVLLGNSDFFSKRLAYIKQITSEHLQKIASKFLVATNSHTLYYQKGGT